MSKMNDYEVPFKLETLESINSDVLDPIEYQYHDKRDIEICITQPEFTSLCPLSSLPDFGVLIIHYIPDKKIVELKSLKYYLMQYRNVGVFYEHVVNRILDDLVSTIDPKSMEVEGKFTSRGGITTSVKASYSREKS